MNISMHSRPSYQLLIESSTKTLKSAGIHSSRLDALVLLSHVTGKDKGWILANLDKKPSNTAITKYRDLTQKRTNRVPIAYLTQKKEFYGFELFVSSSVLIPRPETEALVDTAIELTPKNGSLLEIGTGSGAIVIAVAKNRPDVNITATDISKNALKLAKKNALNNNIEKNIRFVQSDLFNSIKGTFDTICANLPYLPESLQAKTLREYPELKYEPYNALYGAGADGLDLYRRFFAQITKYMKIESNIIIESDPMQKNTLTDIAHSHGLYVVTDTQFIIQLRLGSI
jgi:release factor glutamine methyltransferase